jgi:hypothetical protein
MLTEELAARFGTKLREIELPRQQLPAAMADLLLAIAQADAPRPGGSDESAPSKTEDAPGK